MRADRIDRAGFLLRPAGRADAIAISLFLILGIAACLRLGRGFFLADDFVQLANSAHWQARGELWAETMARFAGSIDGVNGFYRPLTFVSFVVNYLLGGAQPGRWLGVNLAVHLANAALVGWLVARASRAPAHADTIASLTAATLFFVFAPGWEVALWVSCRYDALATLFTLATGALLLSGRRGWAVAASACALLSKEPGSGAIVFAAMVALLQVREHPAAQRPRAWLRITWPWIALGAAYCALRWALFGSITQVYMGVHPQLLSGEHWATLLSSGALWADQVFPGVPGPAGLFASSALLLGCGLWLAWRRDGASLAALLVAVAMAILACALLLPHFLGFETNGIGGRLFYQAAAFYAAAAGIATKEALAALATRRVIAIIACAAAAVLMSANVSWGVRGARDYLSAQRSMRDAAAAIARVARYSTPSDYSLVIVPDSVGRVPFGRNAQAGLMLPPIQRGPLTSRLLVQTEAEMPGLDRTIDGGVLSALREMTLYEFAESTESREWPRAAPTRVFCWDAARREMVRLPFEDPGEGHAGEAIAASFGKSACATPRARP